MGKKKDTQALFSPFFFFSLFITPRYYLTKLTKKSKITTMSINSAYKLFPLLYARKVKEE